jgi:spore coat polysaccharide biosynthesis protein SpsF
MTMNEQQSFWAKQYAHEYIEKNSQFDNEMGVEGWKKILAKAGDIQSVLECGCNIGRNIGFLDKVLPNAKKSVIEISEPAFRYVTNKFDINSSFNGAIVDSNLSPGFDLVFTAGVLIHIHPDDLLANMKKMYDYSGKYILICEYFNRTPVMIEYKGQVNKLFKCDFGRLFIDNFSVTLVDYGFLWGHIYDDAGFDDITWWLFQKS